MSFRRYQAYKDSGSEVLGQVPSHWRVVNLSQLGRFLKGTGGSKEDIVDEGVPCVRYGDLYTTHSFVIREARTRVSEARAADYTTIHYRDVLFAASGEKLEEIGKAAVSLMTVPAVCGGDLIVLRPEQDVDPVFMGYAVDSVPANAQKAAMGRGTTIKHIYPDELRRLMVVVPPVDEQVAIGAFLERETAKIDALVLEQERLIELLKEKRQAVISHAVTKGLNPNAPMKDSGIEWLGQIPAHWTLPPLYVRYEQSLGKMLDTSKLTGAWPMPYLRNLDVRWGRFNLDDLPLIDIRPEERPRYTVRKGDVLMVEGRDLGRCAIWDGDNDSIAFQKALHRLRPRDGSESTRYFYYLMRMANACGAFLADQLPNEIPHLTGEVLRRLRIPKPPIGEQNAIATMLDECGRDVESLLVAAEKTIDLLGERRSALISAAVTGQIDVREASKRSAA